MSEGTCSAVGCDRPIKTKSRRLCGAHSAFLHNHGNLYVSTHERVCGSCGQTKNIGEMRYADRQHRGSAVPIVCQTCRDNHPGKHWCIGHGEFHLVRHFTRNKTTASGFQRNCRAWSSEEMAGKRPPIVCPSCQVEQHFIEFTGGPASRGLHPCRTCRANRRDSLWWCGYCGQWLPADRFDKARHRPNGLVTRCKMCRMLTGHHTTLDELLSLNGTKDFRCGICGTQDGRLCVDHDHSCCPGVYSCGRCVAGILCARCNLIEGNVLTEDRAKSLLLYIQRKAARMA